MKTIYTEVTAQNLRFVRGSRGMNQESVAEILGIAGNQVSKIEKGIRALSPSEKSILDLYFFGIMPKGVPRNTEDLQSTLEFTKDEWRIIEVLANRAGLPPEKWIAAKIREYLTWSEEARGAAQGVNVVPSDPGKEAIQRQRVDPIPQTQRAKA